VVIEWLWAGVRFDFKIVFLKEKMQIVQTERLPIKLWLDDPEAGAMQQIRNIANLPFAFHHIAIMPDCHEGFGMPIGGVLATSGTIIPNAVGVDIGCGMCAIKTNLHHIEKKRLIKIMENIRLAVPVGFNHHKQAQDESIMPAGYEVGQMQIVSREYKSALHQVGTLGGGNHFIEIQLGSDGHIWLMIHSGSRNIGLKVADHYNRLAGKLNEEWGFKTFKSQQLAYLPSDSEEGLAYRNEMNYCIDFAFANRKHMARRICEILHDHTGCDFVPFEGNELINIAHNYAAEETHFSKKVFVHRKGATRAGKGQLGIIPGSQGSKSYIVRGKGSPESFESCSHGAGRKMGRKEAQRKLNLEKEKEKLDRMGILHAVRGTRDLDEAAGAYKDIDLVMQQQTDLVEAVIELKPLAVVKG
jgi:tRNA-splicing ligase RtcB (3'-phosphate/5'-hydroxy nucleic acid ligase)